MTPKPDDFANDLDDYLSMIEPRLTLNRGQKRTDRRTKRAILRLIMLPGTSLADAAQAEALNPGSLSNALAKPNGKNLRRQLHKAVREGWAEQAEATIADIMRNAESATDRMRAAEWIAGISGIAPVKRQKIKRSQSLEALGIVIIDPRAKAEE